MKKYTSNSKIYSVLVPEGYMVEEDERTATIYNETEGVGAVNISSFAIPPSYKFDIESELFDFVSSNQAYSDSSKLLNKKICDDCGECEFFTENNRYWKYWLFFKSDRAVFATYNCDAEDRLFEGDVITSIIKSIEILS